MSQLKTFGSAGTGTPTFEIEQGQRRASILLVDDQPARLLTYEAMLSGLGLQCVRALSGEEALQKLLQQEFAVIVLDVHMPGMDGFEVARLVREHPRMERTPIIFVTGVNVSEFDRLKGYEVGAIDYIAVPVVPEILRTKIALLVELHERRSQLKSLNRELQEARVRIEAEHAAELGSKDAQLRAVFEHPDQIISVLQAERDVAGEVKDWIYRDVNSKALEFLALSREKLIGKRLSEVCIDQPHRSLSACTQALETQSPMRYETRHHGADLLVTVFPGGPDRVVSSAFDMSDRKRTESTLRDNERRSRALIENAPVGASYCAMDGRFEYANEAFCRMLGYTTEELCSKTWQEITHPDDVAEDMRRGHKVLIGEATHYTMHKRYRHKNGSDVWVNLFGNFVRDDSGVPVQGVAIALDITGRRQSDAALSESQDRLLIAKRAAGLGIHDWNVSTGTIQWDERLYELWGIPPNEPITFERFAAGLHPDDVASMQAAVDKSFDPNGDGQYLTIYRVINRIDKLTRWVEATGRVFFEQGRAVRLVGTVRDVTAQHQLQEASKLSERRKDEFLAMLAHELRNPVAPIRNAAEALARLLKHEDQPRSLVAMIQRQSANLTRILDDLLDVARITKGHIDLRRECVAVSASIDLAIETVGEKARQKGHKVTILHPPHPLYVNADKVRLEQCIVNLLSNAVEFTRPSGELCIRAYAEGIDAVIEVIDNGLGIDAQFLPHVFDLFAQSERPLDRSQGGLGVGLSICKQLIELHGGSVSCRSDGLGRGSTFTLRLPLLDQGLDAKSRPLHEPVAFERVLIVDDNRDAADSLAMCLQLEGHEAQAVYTAESALVEVQAFQPHVVLLDIGLPGMDGYEVARRVRARFGEMRLIALTGYGQEADKQRTFAAGFDVHLTKPVDMSTLKDALSSARN